MNIESASILLVDDEEDLLDIFAVWLRSAKCRLVHTALDGRQALDCLLRAQYDLLILDCNMPRMDGISLLRRLKTAGQTNTAIMFISGGHVVDLREVHDLGVRQFLAKPIRRKELLVAAEVALMGIQERWLTPLLVTPRQSINASADTAGNHAKPKAPVLGRGGFTISWNQPLSLGAVSFRYPLPGQSYDLVGEGYIRWRSSPDQLVGIEFAYLEPESRAWVISQVAEPKPSSYIPGLTNTSGTNSLFVRR